MQYRSCLNVTVARAGLYTVPQWIFRFRHPPLLLPWSCVQGIEERQILFARRAEVRFEVEGCKLRFLLPPAATLAIASARGLDP